MKIERAVAAFLGGRGIGEDHDRRFESLGAVHRHHPHAAAGFAQLALDVTSRERSSARKPMQRRLRRLLMRQRQVEELGHDVVDLGAEARAGAF